MSKKAKLRVCASCEWIFKKEYKNNWECPMCGFGSYGARYVYGNRAYKYAITQKPWLEKKVGKFMSELSYKILNNELALDDYNKIVKKLEVRNYIKENQETQNNKTE